MTATTLTPESEAYITNLIRWAEDEGSRWTEADTVAERAKFAVIEDAAANGALGRLRAYLAKRNATPWSKGWSEDFKRGYDTALEEVGAHIEGPASSAPSWPEPTPEAIEALAQAWHHEACKFKAIASHSCRFREPHRTSARHILEALR